MPTDTLPNWPHNYNPAVNQEAGKIAIVSTQVHDTIQAAKAAGAVEGTILLAPLAPATGPIAGKPESMVVVTIQAFWDSPTIKAARNVIGTAVGAVVVVFATACMSVWGKGQSIFASGAINWSATEVSAEVAAGLIIGSALIAWKRTNDNNPVK